MEQITDVISDDHIDFDYPKEEMIFRKTFKVIASTLGVRAFSRLVGNTYAGGFSMGHYEAFSIGLASVIEKVSDNPSNEDLQQIETALDEAKRDPELRKLTVGGGKNFRKIYERKIALVANRVGGIYE